MTKMRICLWNDFKGGAVVALPCIELLCMNNAIQCNDMKCNAIQYNEISMSLLHFKLD